MARPKGPEETHPLHTRLTGSQLAGFREYLRRQQEEIKHTGVQLTDAAVLRGMVLQCLDRANISHSSAQQSLPLASATPSSTAPAAPPSATAPKKSAPKKKPTAAKPKGKVEASAKRTGKPPAKDTEKKGRR